VGAARASGSAIALPHGTVVTRSAAGRRLRERDRHGHDLARLEWRGDGALARASTRIPDGSWLTIEPRATADAPWGLSDRLWHRGAPLTVFQALDYTRIGFIPALAEPGRLPPGAGTAVLNLIAGLAADQGGQPLAYRGPYPGEQLFLALLESFRHEDGEGDPLGAFMNARLTWLPAPHERVAGDSGIWIQLRDGIEKVVWEGRPYVRPLCQGIRRHAARRLRDHGGRVICSLHALGLDLEDHLRMSPGGEAIEVLPAEPLSPQVFDGPPGLLPGVAAAAAARSAPPLAPFILESAAELRLEWGPIERDLVMCAGDRLRVSSRLLPAIRARLGDGGAPDDGLNGALAAVAELGHLAGDALRARAQDRVSSLAPEAQAALLEHPSGIDQAECARAIAGAVRALLDWPATRSRGGSA
jgi:hypothetical protein